MLSPSDRTNLINFINAHLCLGNIANARITLGGGCGSCVRSLIELGTGKEIVNQGLIFLSGKDMSNVGTVINSINQFPTTTGEILLVVRTPKMHMVHYAISAIGINGLIGNTLGINGFIDHSFSPMPYKGLVGSTIRDTHFRNGAFCYDNGSYEYQLRKVDYNLARSYCNII